MMMEKWQIYERPRQQRQHHQQQLGTYLEIRVFLFLTHTYTHTHLKINSFVCFLCVVVYIYDMCNAEIAIIIGTKYMREKRNIIYVCIYVVRI